MVDRPKPPSLSYSGAFLLLAVFGLASCAPVLRDWFRWGQADWDQFAFWNAVARSTILHHGQFPHWNPYANGGNVLLAHPHSMFLSPVFLLVLAFGEVAGLKLQLVGFLVAGLWGAFLLARRLGATHAGSLLASVVFMGSSVYPLHSAEGHAEWFYLGLFPWAALGWRKSLDDGASVGWAAAAFSLMILGGAVDVPSIAVLLLAVWASGEALRLRSAAPLGKLAGALAVAALLCAVKLGPMLDFVAEFPRADDFDAQHLRPDELKTALLDRDQAGLYERARYGGASRQAHEADIRRGAGLDAFWHECGAYVGPVTLGLAALGAAAGWRLHWPLLISTFACLLLVLGRASPVDLWGLLHELPIYSQLGTPSRFIAGLVFGFALLSGLGLSWLERRLADAREGFARAVPATVLAAVAVDLALAARPIYALAFPTPPLPVERGARFFQVLDGWPFSNPPSYSALYPNFLAGRGVVNGYEVLSVPRGRVTATSVRSLTEPWEAFEEPDGRWTPVWPAEGVAGSFLFFDYSGVVAARRPSAVLLATTLRSELGGPARMHYYREAGLSVRLNGGLLASFPYAKTRLGREWADLPLRPGDNRMLLRLEPSSDGTPDLRLALGLPEQGDVRATPPAGEAAEAFLAAGTGSVSLLEFSPNRVGVAVESEGGRVALNQNFHRGWSASLDGRPAPVEPFEGLASVRLPAGRHEAVFRYRAPLFSAGAALSALTAAAWLGLGFLRRPR